MFLLPVMIVFALALMLLMLQTRNLLFEPVETTGAEGPPRASGAGRVRVVSRQSTVVVLICAAAVAEDDRHDLGGWYSVLAVDCSVCRPLDRGLVLQKGEKEKEIGSKRGGQGREKKKVPEVQNCVSIEV